jgi:GT2 family glycosyltransferase
MGSIGLVAIGRNEGERLRACLASAGRLVDKLVYVDSGSTDGSIALAQELGAEVVDLDLSLPFTAARARNEGFARLSTLLPDLEFVQFIDGDCELDSDWIAKASAFLRSHDDVAVACGRRRERNPGASVYNRLCDMEWDTPVGETDACGGDALIRSAAFRQVSGYEPSLIAGEEPDMCWRMKQHGWRIYRLDAEMTLHDAAMTRFSQWWLRNKRSGHASAEAYQRRKSDGDKRALREILSNVAWSLPPAWPLWPLLWLRVYQRRRDTAFATFIVLGKLPHFHGQLKFWMDRARRRHSRIIEYK